VIVKEFDCLIIVFMLTSEFEVNEKAVWRAEVDRNELEKG
jgi:hypothetical protein